MSNFRHRVLTFASAFLAVSGIASAQSSPASTKTQEEEIKLEKFEVTGSRIRRIDAATPAPVVAIGRPEIEATGYTSIQDLLKNLPSNTGSSNQTFQTSSFTRGAATLNPRGLGGNRFLVLINGRRAPSYALSTSSNTSVFDFNSIPLSAVDRIEFLKDGASAIYGSDAVTGVYNIILRKDYEGLEVTMRYGNTLGHDISYRQADIVAGARSKGTQITVVASYMAQNSSFIRDYDRSKTTDYTLGGTRVGNQFVNQNSTLSFPFNFTLTRAQALAQGFDLSGVPSSASTINIISNNSTTGQGTPTVSGFSVAPGNVIPNSNRYDFARTYQIEPAFDNYSSFVNLNHDFAPNLTGFLMLGYNQNSFDYQFTPTPIQFAGTPLPSPVANPIAGGSPATYSTLFIPATNPYNPFGINLTGVLGRTNFGPPRIFETESTASSVLAGLRGSAWENITWETGFQHSSSSVSTVSRNQIRVTDFQNALLGTTRTTAFNPFGPSDNPALLNNIFTISNSSAKFTSNLWDLTASDPEVLPIPSAVSSVVTGYVGLATGVEWRQETLDSRPDTQAYIGTGGGLPFKGQRTIKSVFLEGTVPLIKAGGFDAEAQLAVRHEKYSDFGNTTKPKYGAKLKLPDNPFVGIVLRGSYSESFAAPNIGQVYSAQTTGFSSSNLQDPLRPSDPPQQIRSVSGGAGAGHLQPETARIKYLGTVLDIPFVRQHKWGELSLEIDFFDMTIHNVIATPSAQQVLTYPDIFPDKTFVVRDDTSGYPGPISYVRTTPANLALWKYRGFDYTLDYTMKDTSVGTFNLRFTATQLQYIGYNSGIGFATANNVGLWANPEWNANVELRWRYKNWAVDNFFNYTGGFTNDLYGPLFWMDPKITWNPSVAYKADRWWPGLTLKIGASNVLNTDPNIVGRETPGFDPNITSGDLVRGRFVYVQVKKVF